METTFPAICGGPPLLVHNLAKETEHNSVHGKIPWATIERGGNTVYYNINVKPLTLSYCTHKLCVCIVIIVVPLKFK